MIGQGDNGWIKLSRRIVNHWLWDDAERLKWWLDLLMMAAWEERQVMHDSHLITLRRGQMIASVGFLRDRWKRSHQTILRFLNLIEKENMIKRSMMYRQTSIITICNYESYQVSSDSGVDTIKETIKDTQVETIVYINKEDKEYNKTTCVDLKDELYTLLSNKYSYEMTSTLKNFKSVKEINELTSDNVYKLSRKIALLKNFEKELEKMKHGSIAYIHQITTISKQRIFKTPILSGIRISPQSLDLIDEKIDSLFTKNSKN